MQVHFPHQILCHAILLSHPSVDKIFLEAINVWERLAPFYKQMKIDNYLNECDTLK